jgi:SAM-dependent methyltransferase
VAVGVATPPHGAADRIRLEAIVPLLVSRAFAFRPWSQPRSVTGRQGRPGVNDPGTLLWSDLVWLRRFVDGTTPDASGTIRPSGFDGLLAAIGDDPALLAGRRLVYDVDADLLDPRPGTLASGADRAQVAALLAAADLVTVSSETLRARLADHVPNERLVVLPSAPPLIRRPAGAQQERHAVPVVGVIDTLDGPGGIEAWLPAVARVRAEGLPLRLVRLADPVAPEIDGFDEVLRADEGTGAWLDALDAMAPDIVLAPSLDDRFAAACTDLAWAEATAAGAAVIASGSPVAPYRALLDGSDARLASDPRDVASALSELVRSPSARAELVAGAQRALLARPSGDHVGESWADAFRWAIEHEPRCPSVEGEAAFARRRARRGALGGVSLPTGAARRGHSFGLVGLADPTGMAAALDAAARVEPAPVEIVLAGPEAALAAVERDVRDMPAAQIAVRLVAVPDLAPPGAALAAAVAATRADWLGILDAAAELHRDGVRELLDAARANGLDALYGQLLVAGPDGTVQRSSDWPPSCGGFHDATLIVSAEAESGSTVLDWLLRLMEAGCRTGSTETLVARWLPPAARTMRIASTGAAVPYADGGEDRLLGIVGGAQDRSSTSDELAKGISDWTTRYHLSRLRGNIVGSVAFPTGARVIDVGAGTGTIARSLGERGLEVVALEGSFDRARVAAVRCADLPSVSVVHGTVGEYEAPGEFDAVVVIGVLEYSGSFSGGAAGPAAFLGRVRRLLRPGGVLVLAIENQLGLKYLQGYCEDHLARPWVGVDGYSGSRGVRTWSRRVLRGMLEEAGFAHQRWRYPFPDYKLPTVVVDEHAYQAPEAATFVDALIREPIRDYANPRTIVRDDRGAHAAMLQAGLGEDVANSFLVIASADPASLEAYAPSDGPLAWLFGDERGSRWLRRRTVVRDGEGLAVVAAEGASVVETCGLVQQRAAREAFVSGATLEQEFKEALAEDGLAGARRVLAVWRTAVEAEARALRGAPAARQRGTGQGGTAVSAPGGRRALPGTMLDLVLSNFIRSPEGPIERIDREWCVEGEIERDVALLRALWYLASSIARGAWPGPWSSATPVPQIAAELAQSAGITVDDALFERFRLAENWLQERVQRPWALPVGPEPEAGGR